MENLINKYLIDPDSYEVFDNITRFMKNAKVKNDSKKIYEDENRYSSILGKYLVKYFEEELTNEDILELVETVSEYNEQIDKYWENNANLSFAIWGYTDDSDKLKTIYPASSLFARIVNKYTAIYSQQHKNFTENAVKSIIAETIVNEITGKENEEAILSKAMRDYFGIPYSKDNNNPIILDDSFKSNIGKDIAATEKRIKSKDKIIFFKSVEKDTSSNSEKRSASSKESTWAEQGEMPTFFDLRHIGLTAKDDKLLALFNDVEVTNYISAFNGDENDVQKKVNFLIQYKELNKDYRKLLDCNVVDNAIALMDISDNTALPSTYFDKTNAEGTRIKSTLFSALRNLDVDDIIVRNGHESNRYKYFHGNPYIARVSVESSIVGYYYGDNWAELSNGYGKYIYQRNEINTFLNIYEETREYFYKVLLNKSFINESFYPVYEKSFIAFVAIERFLDSKISLLRDIDSFDRTDISNFMESYGLKELDQKLKNGGEFINQEYYLKKLLHNHISLINEKGSKAVVDKLMKIFDYGTDEITITKYMIYDEQYTTNIDAATKKIGVNKNKRVNFIEVPYFSTTNNMLKDVNDEIKGDKVEYEKFINDGHDIYWDTKKITEDTILNGGLSLSETKYLSLKISEDFSSNFVRSRYILSFADSIFNNEIISDSDNTVSSIDMSYSGTYKLITLLIRLLYQAYTQRSFSDSEDNNLYYWVNFENLKNDIANKKVVGNEKYAEILNKYISYEKKENKNNGFYISCKPDGNTGKMMLSHLLETELDGNDEEEVSAIKNIIESLNLVYALTSANMKNDREEFYKKLVNLSSDGINVSEYFSKILEFPIDCLSGKYTATLETNNFRHEYEELLDAIFKRYYTVDAKIDPAYPNEITLGDDATTAVSILNPIESLLNIANNGKNISIKKDSTKISDEDRLEISSILINLVNAIRDVFATTPELQFYISIGESIEKQLDFMTDVVNYFISYTTQLRDSEFIRVYNNANERVILTDSIAVAQTDVHADTVYYDEKFKIKEAAE